MTLLIVVIHSEEGWLLELCQVGLQPRRVILLTAKLTSEPNHFRFSAVTDQGIKNHTNAEATLLAVRNCLRYCTCELFIQLFIFVGHKP